MASVPGAWRVASGCCATVLLPPRNEERWCKDSSRGHLATEKPWQAAQQLATLSVTYYSMRARARSSCC
eukprot:6464096-Amphidinium_carterae.2